MGRTLGWWLTVGIVLGLFFAFIGSWALSRPFEDWLVYGLGGGVVIGLLLSWSSH
jgi:hypothetical protein